MTTAFALMSAAGVRADLVWEYPFDGLGGVWTSNGRWGQTADSAYIHRDRYIMGGGGGPETKTLAYHLYLVPYGVDSLTFDMDQTWSLTGYPISGGWGASIALSALVDGSDSHIIVYESATGSSSNAPAAVARRGHVQYTLPAIAGQDILFRVRRLHEPVGHDLGGASRLGCLEHDPHRAHARGARKRHLGGDQGSLLETHELRPGLNSAFCTI